MTVTECMQALAKFLHKPCMVLHFPNECDFDKNGQLKPAPFINFLEHGQILMDGDAILVFDSDEEMELHYNQVVGDSPTKMNSYNGDCRIYAVTCDAEGNLLHENT